MTIKLEINSLMSIKDQALHSIWSKLHLLMNILLPITTNLSQFCLHIKYLHFLVYILNDNILNMWVTGSFFKISFYLHILCVCTWQNTLFYKGSWQLPILHLKHFISPLPLTTQKRNKYICTVSSRRADEPVWSLVSSQLPMDVHLFDTCKLWAFELLVFNGKLNL